jgi:hypothetical protein
MERKDFLKSIALGALSSSVLLTACGGGNTPQQNTTTTPEATPNPTPAAPEASASSANCNDLSGLTEAEINARNSVGYVEKTEDSAKNCGNCRFYQPGTQANGCGGCQLFKGPVNEGGNCKSWFAKA